MSKSMQRALRIAKLPIIDWSRLGAKAIVIIVSVLAALALDDWRDARADRELEHLLIVSLKEDLTADLLAEIPLSPPTLIQFH